jgi:hypothetical protein
MKQNEPDISETEGAAFLQQLDAEIAGRKTSGTYSETARFGARLAQELKADSSDTAASSAGLRAEVEAKLLVSQPAAKTSAPAGVVGRTDENLQKRFRIGVLDIAAAVAVIVLLTLTYRNFSARSLEPTHSMPNVNNVAAEGDQAASEDIPLEEPTWKKDIQAKLQKRVSFRIVDKPFSDHLSELEKQFPGLSFQVSPRLREKGEAMTPITLSVSDMEAEFAIDWMCTLVDLKWHYAPFGIVIADRNAFEFGDTDLRLYDIADILGNTTDAKLSRKNEEDLAKLIAEGLFERDLVDYGMSVSVNGSKIVVSGTPDFHAKVKRAIQILKRDINKPVINIDPAEPIAAWQKALLEKLTPKISVSYDEVALPNVCADFQKQTGVPIIIDPRLLKDPSMVTFKATDLPACDVLDWILRMSSLRMLFRNGVVFVTPKFVPVPTTFTIYDVSDLVGAAGGDAEVKDMARRFQQEIDPASWDGLQNWIEVRLGRLCVKHTPEMQRTIETLLESMRKRKTK